MGVYVHFTEEQKHRANHVDLVDFLRRRGEKLLPSGRDKRLAADHSITVRDNRWYDHASEHGGFAVDFVRRFYGLSYPDAVTMLLGGEQGEVYKPAVEKQPEPKQPFALPTPHSDMRRVYAYLVKTRCIDRAVVNYFAKAKLLYESCEQSRDGMKEYHNAVFVGCDENGIPRHAHKRGLCTTGTGFKGNVDSCDPAYSFHYIGADEHLYVFEAPIDLLSYISLHPADWQRHSYVALCGVSGQAMLRMLTQCPQLSDISLCLDNDEAGHRASERLKDQLAEKGYAAQRLIPQQKDWNDDLVTVVQQRQHGFEMEMV